MKKSNQEWYATAFEKLSPLRYHIDELLEEMDSHNRVAKRLKIPGLSTKRITAAKKALEVAEEFCTGKSK